jgi:hypothetical protein
MRLISTSNWGNVGPNFDAVRLTVRKPGVRADGFTSMVVVPGRGFDRPRRDTKLSGLYLSWDLRKNAAVLDTYSFWKSAVRSVDVYTYGIRSAGKLDHDLDYNVEMALERGHAAAEAISAWAGHWEMGRRFGGVPAAPRVALEYNYSTGDGDAHDGRRQTFDQLYPTNIYGTAADFGWRNLHEPVAYVEWQPSRKWKFKTAYHAFWLAKRRDALYTCTGAVFVYRPDALHSRVGEEIDTRVGRQVGTHLQLWVGYARLFAGPYLKEAGKGAVDYPYAMWTYSF